MSLKLFTDQTAADKTTIGFDFQYYYFLYLLLDIRHGETVGLEVKDDIHIDLDDKTILIQAKHTLKNKVDGEKINLTERDNDLWHTLGNWVQIINDPAAGRDDIREQLKYIEKTDFVLVSNKNISLRNNFFKKCKELKENKIEHSMFIGYLNILLRDTKDSISNQPLLKSINLLKSQPEEWLKLFIPKLRFELGTDDVIGLIKKRLLEKIHLPDKIDDVFNCIDSTVRANNYYLIKNGFKASIQFEEFNKKFSGCFRIGLSPKLPRRKYESALPKDLLQQNFIQQLIQIGDIEEDDEDDIMHFTRLKLLMYNHLHDWEEEGFLLPEQKERFLNNCINEWKISFDSRHRNNKKDLKRLPFSKDLEMRVKEAALKCIDDVRRLKLKIEDEELDSELSNGQFYLLNDESKIWWHLNLGKSNSND